MKNASGELISSQERITLAGTLNEELAQYRKVARFSLI